MEIAELIFIPGHGMGHLVPAVEMAKLLTTTSKSISITFLVIDAPFETGTDSYTQSISKDPFNRRIHFRRLPPPPPPLEDEKIAAVSQVAQSLRHISDHKTSMREAVSDLCRSGSRIAGVVVDIFCLDMVEVADEFDLPCYVFFTCSAAFLGLKLFAQMLKDEQGIDIADYRDSKEELRVPSFLHSVPARVLPSAMLDKHHLLPIIQNFGRILRRSKGILVNTFSELEPYAIESMSDGKTPTVYPIGPVINSSDNDDDDHELMQWLNLQPPLSVVFLCFGSFGSFCTDQVAEIAAALERGGWRFLWSLREPSDLPEGFLEQTRGTGKVIGWAPQKAVLSHPSVGAFVSHCGWNSILESVWLGVPIAAWPMYAEQQINAFQLVVELEIAADIKMDYRSDLAKSDEQEDENENPSTPAIVSEDEIESGIRTLMAEDRGRIIREKMKDLKEKSRLAFSEGGSSYNSLGLFIKDLNVSLNS